MEIEKNYHSKNPGASDDSGAGPACELADLARKMDHLIDFVGDLGDKVKMIEKSNDLKTYASKVKENKENMKEKNLLLIKSTTDVKLGDKKKLVDEALKETDVIDTRFAANGNLVVNFADRAERSRAAQNILEGVADTEVREIRKLKPKIMLANVNKEEDADDVIDILIDRNCYL